MFLYLLHVFLVVCALAILIFIVTILTLARSNNFVCIFLYLQRASLVGFFWSSFFWSSSFILLFLIFLFYLFFFFLVSRTSLCFISLFYYLVIFWCDICVWLEVINLSLLFYLPCTFVLVTLVFCRVWGGVVLTLLVPYCVCVVDR